MDTPNAHETFWKAIEIYLLKPHVINKRISGVVHVGYANVPAGLATSTVDCVNALSGHSLASVQALTIAIDGTPLEVHANCSAAVQTLLQNPPSQDRIVAISKLLSKNASIFANTYEIVVLDFIQTSATFICIPDPNSSNHCSAADPPFSVSFDQHQIAIHTDAATTTKAAHWLQNNLLPKLQSWSQPIGAGTSQRSINSNSLLDCPEAYINLYNELKLKYGLDMVARWPEQTDAAKFVYEDVAIATYLLLLWRQERVASNSDRLQSFVDLGCGNGLLVYILSSEGHSGYGIDLRKRGIWDMYPESTVLKVEAIVPSDTNLYPDIDWIIGNHSDELSPWIPVIAARSSYSTRYFVLPCCAFEFNGAKFQRRNANESQYNDFMNYVADISNACGFDADIDRLKIPSTKRVCLVGARRRHTADQFDENCRRIQRYIDGETKSECANPQSAWSNAFKPRPSVEEVRNCSKLERSIQDEIVHTVVEHLLKKRRYLDGVGVKWNCGGVCPILEMVQLVQPDLLKKLKSECGGLQTLLKNHNQIFLVQKGMVQIRSPLSKADRAAAVVSRRKNARFLTEKKRQCWFFANHPDGCPHPETECSFLHLNVTKDIETVL